MPPTSPERQRGGGRTPRSRSGLVVPVRPRPAVGRISPAPRGNAFMTAPAAAPPDSKPGQGLKVLVIDDNRSHAEVMAETLGRVGYDCVVAGSGSAGARQLEQGELDVVLT